MTDHDKYSDIINEIRSLPEPNYDKKFNHAVQDDIHENLLHFARSYTKKKRRNGKMKRVFGGLASVAAIVLFAILIVPMFENSPLSSNDEKGQNINDPSTTAGNDVDKDKDVINQDQTDNDETIEENLYENTQYGFTFLLPKSWEGYQVVTESWEGSTIENQQSNVPLEGPLLLIRHPKWTEAKQRQDIPLMIFTLDQWSSLQQGEYHIGAAPIGPRQLGQNNKYVFALPARYNFEYLEGYEEVEEILESDALQPINSENS